MNVLIIINGPLPSRELLESERAKADLIIAANGGANRAHDVGLRADFVVGDLDSMDEDLRTLWPDTKFVHRPSQYATDFEKALQLALEHGATAAEVIGVSGGRFDHQLTNLNIMQRFSQKLALTCLDDDGFGQFVRRRVTLPTTPGQQITLSAFQKASGITTSGLKYPLENGTLEWGVNDGQSNEAVASEVTISIRRGVLFVFVLWPESDAQ